MILAASDFKVEFIHLCVYTYFTGIKRKATKEKVWFTFSYHMKARLRKMYKR